MQLPIEGPGIPDVRDGTDAEHMELKTLIDKAYETWLEQLRHDTATNRDFCKDIVVKMLLVN